MSELAKWVKILWGFTKSNSKQVLKVSAFYLEKQKSFIPKKNFFGRTAKVDPKDGVSCPNFQWRFWDFLQEFRQKKSWININISSHIQFLIFQVDSGTMTKLTSSWYLCVLLLLKGGVVCMAFQIYNGIVYLKPKTFQIFLTNCKIT